VALALGIGANTGRLLGEVDGAEAPRVAVISNSLAQRYFPGENPIGKHIGVGSAFAAAASHDSNSDYPWMTIVGVVDDLHYGWISKEAVPIIYRPFRRSAARIAPNAPPFDSSSQLWLVSAIQARNGGGPCLV
jgi:hypothetical protein